MTGFGIPNSISEGPSRNVVALNLIALDRVGSAESAVRTSVAFDFFSVFRDELPSQIPASLVRLRGPQPFGCERPVTGTTA